MIKYILSFTLLFNVHTSFAIQCKVTFNNDIQIEFLSPKKKPHFVTKLSNNKLIVNFLKPTSLSCSKNIVINKVNSKEYVFLLPDSYSKLSLSENKNSRFIKLSGKKKSEDKKSPKKIDVKKNINDKSVNYKSIDKVNKTDGDQLKIIKEEKSFINQEKVVEKFTPVLPIKRNMEYSPFIKYGHDGFAIIFPKLGKTATAISCLDDNLLIFIEGDINYQSDITKSFRDRDLFKNAHLKKTNDFLILEVELIKQKNVVSFWEGEDLVIFCLDKNIKQNFLKYSIDTEIKISSKDFNKSYKYKDQYGRDLTIYPSTSGMDKKLSFPKLIIHKSANGVILESLSDNLESNFENRVILIKNIPIDSKYPTDEKYDEADLRTTIFPFLKGENKFMEDFEAANYHYGKSEDLYDLLEIIKVLFKYSQYKEIIGIADELLAKKPEIFEQNIDAIMIVSAACIMESENSIASKVMRAIKDINFPDVEFWANLTNKKVELKNLLELKDLYPYEIIDFAIKIDPSEEKVKFLYQEDTDILFLKGKFLYDKDQFEAAYKIWAQIPKQDYKNIAKTIYLKSLRTKSLEDIPNLLDGSRLWRGTETEYMMLVTIAEIYRDNGKLVDAMRRYRQILEIRNLPSSSIFISSEMSKIFHQIFGKGNIGESIPDFDFISLFYEFRDFMPLGKEGDDITFNIAQRLLKLDLYDQASQILRYQIIYKMRGEERVIAANNLSQIYLENDQFKDAISILEDTDRYNFDYNLHTKRLEMRAEALLNTGKVDEAYDMISDNQSIAAKALKERIYIKKELWDLLPSVISKNDKLSILNLISAYAITNNFIALEKIKSETTNESIKEIIDFFLINKRRLNFFDIKNSLNFDTLKNYKEFYFKGLNIKL